MKFLIPFYILGFLLFMACEEEDPVFPDEVVLSCQEDVDMISPLLIQGVVDPTDLAAGFRGDVIIQNSTGSCGSPITSLPFFEAYQFWRGSIRIESDDITNLDFLSSIEQIRGGLSIRNCANLAAVELPSCAFIGEFLVVNNNPNLSSIQIGQNHPEDTYETIELDSVIISDNPLLATWSPGLSIIDFIRAATITNNPLLTDLSALSNLSMPSSFLEFELHNTTINADGMNSDLDSLLMPINTLITAELPDNDYSWLSKAIIRPRFDEDGQDIGTIESFRIIGEVTVPELCPLAAIADTTGLEVIATINGSNMEITPETLEAECP